MNYVCLIVKIITEPRQSFFDENATVTEFWVKFNQTRKSSFIDFGRVSIWGDLGYEVAKYYQINDYILIEGFLTIDSNCNFDNQKNEYIEISFKLKTVRNHL